MSKTRIVVAALSLSAAGLVGILNREGYSDEAIIPTNGDVPTIGFGATENVKLGDKTDPLKAVNRALMDSKKYEGAIKRCVQSPLTQTEYDVYALLAYNIGERAFCSSTIVKRLNAQDYAGACDAILMWKMYPGQDCSKPNKVCGGIWKDRLRSHEQCMGAQ